MPLGKGKMCRDNKKAAVINSAGCGADSEDEGSILQSRSTPLEPVRMNLGANVVSRV